MNTKTNDLTGPALDWAVAKCEGDEYTAESGVNGIGMEYEATRYSTDWSQGGPIVDKMIVEGMEVWQGNLDLKDNPVVCILEILNGKKYIGQGTTLLIAAMRCYVLYKLGEEVEVPSELS
jgi:hypothetical protein